MTLEAPPARAHFPGLDALRFFAAMFVVIGHIPLTQASRALPSPAPYAFSYRGEPAVSFFFTLSGFLITYLLLAELQRTGTVSIPSFYRRRMLRIWPLYFAVVAFGLFFYNLLLPRLGVAYEVQYPIWLAVVLYVAFLPNLMNAMYTVGGILNPLWSIGIEEQFYLTWAPTVRRFSRHIPWILAVVAAVSLAVSLLNNWEVAAFGRRWPMKFLAQLKFHFIAGGAFLAWAFVRHRARLLALPIFATTLGQLACFALLLDYYFLWSIRYPWWLDNTAQMVLYGWLIVTVAVNPRNRVPVGRRWFDPLGKISYSIYMVHMVAVYLTAFCFLRTAWWHQRPTLYLAAFYGMAIVLTLVLATLSYRFIEKSFLALKARKT